MGVKSLQQKNFFSHLFTLFKRFFAPTSQSPMSKLLRVSEFLGKSDKKKWSQIWKLLLVKVVKLPHKKMFFWKFCLTSRFFLYWCYYPHWSRDLFFSPVCEIFKESALWANYFYKSNGCMYVCLSAGLSVRHTFSLRLTVFLSLLPEVQCPWAKLMKRSGLR